MRWRFTFNVWRVDISIMLLRGGIDAALHFVWESRSQSLWACTIIGSTSRMIEAFDMNRILTWRLVPQLQA
jgi:hypothetical protein